MGRSTALPFLVACAGIATFCLMDALMKGLSLAIGVYNAMLWRMLAGAVFAGALFLALRRPWPARAALRIHVLRGFVSTFVSVTFFWGIVRVPLAEGIAITFIAPLIALYLAALMLGERVGPSAIVASLLGLGGVVTIVAGKLQTGHSQEAMRGLAVLVLSSVAYAYSLILQRRQALLAKPLEIAFFQSLLVFLLLLLVAPFMAALPPAGQLPLIAASAGTSLLAIGLLAWAYARAEAQVLLPVEYTAFVWAALLGYWMFGEALGRATLAGTVLIVAGCVLANYRRRLKPAIADPGQA
jgi:S-adenosylmethionine uptake transporter